MTWRSSTMLLFSMCGIARGSSQRLRTGHWLSPVVNRMTSWPAWLRPRASRSMTASVPPYPSGGTGSHGGAIRATFMALPQFCGYRCALESGRLSTFYSPVDRHRRRGSSQPALRQVDGRPRCARRVDPEYPAVDSDPGEAGGNCLPEAAEGGDVQAAGRGVGEVAQVQVRGHPQ